jgi:hypothetical protein
LDWQQYPSEITAKIACKTAWEWHWKSRFTTLFAVDKAFPVRYVWYEMKSSIVVELCDEETFRNYANPTLFDKPSIFNDIL